MTRAQEISDLLAGVTITTADNSQNLILVSTDADANVGPELHLRRNSSSPANADLVGEISFNANNDAGEDTNIASIDCQLNNVADGSEEGGLLFRTKVAGTMRSRMTMYGTNTKFNDDSQDIDFTVESNNNANMLFVDAGNDKVGIGTNSPANKLSVVGGDFGTLLLDNANTSHGTQILFQANGTANTGCDIQMSDAGGLKIRTLAVEHMSFHTAASAGSPVERLRIQTDGRIGIGTTSAIQGEDISHEYNSNDGVGLLMNSTDTQGTTHDQVIFRRNGANVGSISTNGAATAYNTSSDYRLKENVDYTWDATSRLKQLKPARFNFIADADTTVDGFLAHEVSSIVPESITGTKDETRNVTNAVLLSDGKLLAENITEDDWTAGKLATTDSDGNTVDAIYPSNSTWTASHTEPVMQGIDQSKLVPLLVKTILELEARIASLEA